MKKILFALLVLLALPLLYLASVIIYGTKVDYQPEEIEPIEVVNNPVQPIQDSTFSFLIWNIGYAALGKEADFFYDGGTMVHTPHALVQRYFEHIKSILKANDTVDFILLQEVDVQSTRSYKINEVDTFKNLMRAYGSAFALNYNVPFVPMPLTNPLGKCKSGVISFFKNKCTVALRQGFVKENFEYPKKVFFLDRCMLETRFTLPNNKELVVYNTHKSAYDLTGKLKQAELVRMKYLIDIERKMGNYVVVGGDWNQLPPGVSDTLFTSSPTLTSAPQSQINSAFIDDTFAWVYDASTPTNRSLQYAYQQDSTYKTLIDYFLISTNLSILSIKTSNLDFVSSDHQPVILHLKIK